ncbi:efflux RND transporter periplasmic adaptor subunit [Paludibaculum fermentans]|uniref:efflux RND transporter periplasmic adaptor subunit n=1 Tax=Paludibaculum fermentans TaxID=1473598 RepID=UPI003EB966AD
MRRTRDGRNKTSILLVVLAVGAAACSKHEEEEAVKPLVQVSVVQVERANLAVSVQAPASVFAREQANLAARLTAPIRELRVHKGDMVAAGQVLARLDDRDLKAQRDEAAAAVADAQATLEKTTGSTLPTDIERARGQVATAQAALNQAQKFYDRRRQLYEQGAIPQRDLVMAETDLAQAKTAYEVAQKSRALLEGQSKERDITIARSRLEQAKAHLTLVETQLQFAEIRSPFGGFVVEQFVFPGDMAKPDTPMFTVADLSTAVARAQVPAGSAGGLKVGQRCVFTASDRPEQKMDGRITVVNQAVDAARRTVETWCEISNGKHALKAGEFGGLSVVTGQLEQIPWVPLKAVQFEEGTRKGMVLVVEQKKAKWREVETGPTIEGKVPILSGLKGGEIVIVDGGYGLVDDTAVEIVAPKADKP